MGRAGLDEQVPLLRLGCLQVLLELLPLVWKANHEGLVGLIEKTRTYFDCDMTACEAVSTGIGSVVVVAARSPGKETANEDSAAIIPAGTNALGCR